MLYLRDRAYGVRAIQHPPNELPLSEVPASHSHNMHYDQFLKQQRRLAHDEKAAMAEMSMHHFDEQVVTDIVMVGSEFMGFSRLVGAC